VVKLLEAKIFFLPKKSYFCLILKSKIVYFIFFPQFYAFKKFKMKKILFFLLLIFQFGFSQSEERSVNIEVYIMNEPLAGASVYIKGNNSTFITDFNGKAILNFDKIYSDSIFELRFMGSPVKFKLYKNCNLIKIKIDSKKIEYFFDDKLLKKKKLKT